MQFPFSISRESRDDAGFATKMVDDCLSEAIRQSVSDIHFQPRRDCWEVFYRIDGVLHLAKSIPHDSTTSPVARLMSLAKLPSYMGGVPQEGAFQWTDQQNQPHEMRLGIFSTVHGNRAVIRIMGQGGAVLRLDQLGLDGNTTDRLKNACDARDGWILIAGPAGSGKTTTLYACLQYIASNEKNRSVLTIEDPVESIIESISQSQLQPNSGLTLAAAMRSAVRQDAEVLLVSEIRDDETAEAVLSASMTGHLCFSSIHARSLGSTLRRLVQMQLPTYAIRSGLRAVVCQRLVRRICEQCQAVESCKANCDSCHGTGYRGRVPLFQLIEFDGADLSQTIFNRLESGAAADEIDQLVHERSGLSLRGQAAELIENKITDANEVFRVLGRHA
ncbi:MAG: Flp pilus assembly complex ATPase component [Planctomycetaceae bacterium]|nr:Flp pilus assembly complex ATPase component [Planctomycetaceae bacterium]